MHLFTLYFYKQWDKLRKNLDKSCVKIFVYVTLNVAKLFQIKVLVTSKLVVHFSNSKQHSKNRLELYKSMISQNRKLLQFLNFLTSEWRQNKNYLYFEKLSNFSPNIPYRPTLIVHLLNVIIVNCSKITSKPQYVDKIQNIFIFTNCSI